MVDLITPPPAIIDVDHDGDEGHDEHHGATGILKWMTSTDHKVIGLSYTVTSVVMLIIGGLFAEIIRAQLASPNGTLVSLAQYNELFTMHGSVMIYLFAGPFAFGGLANIIVPIQIGAPDMAFPRLNALSYWLYLMGSITMLMASSPPAAPPTLAGSPTHRSRTRSTRRGPGRPLDRWTVAHGFSQSSPASI